MAVTNESVVIDRSEEPDRYRFVCPNGHTSWDRTNNHIWCPSCRRQAEHGADMDPEHYEVFDKKTGQAIPWQNVKLAEDTV